MFSSVQARLPQWDEPGKEDAKMTERLDERVSGKNFTDCTDFVERPALTQPQGIEHGNGNK